MTTPMDDQRTPGLDRREFARVRDAKPCKVQDLRTGKFIPAKTRDVSSGGVMIEAHWPTNIRPGDEVAVYLGSGRETILTDANRKPARVVRVLRGDAVILAIAYDEIAGDAVRIAA